MIFKFLLHELDPDDIPDVFRRDQAENQAGKEDGGAGPFKLSSLAIIKVRAAKLYKECDGEDHIQCREHHLLHHALDLLGRLRYSYVSVVCC